MEDLRKEIRFYGMKPSKKLMRNINRQLQKWLTRHDQLQSPQSDAAYWVCFERDDEACLCCHLEVKIGNDCWESHDIGKSVQDALTRALKNAGKSLKNTTIFNLARPKLANAII